MKKQRFNVGDTVYFSGKPFKVKSLNFKNDRFVGYAIEGKIFGKGGDTNIFNVKQKEISATPPPEDVGEYSLEATMDRFFNGNKHQKLFLKNIRRNADNEIVEVFTKKGGKVYEKMVDALYQLHKLFGDITTAKAFLNSLENISCEKDFCELVDDCDSICNEECY